jgi:cell division protein FtsI/penicillin-binding protein 2
VPGVVTVTGSVPVPTSTVERAEDGFGQGKDQVSPFGMALVASTVVKGSIPTPTLIRGTQTKVNTPAQQPVPGPVLDSMRQMMRAVVTDGTAKAIRDIPDVAGKTGTAQFGDGANSHGWFVGYRGDLAFAVLLVGAGTSAPAVVVGGNFLRAVH